ncbi:MAG: 50S ribosomal protein L7ae [Ruminococcaceae bacterium]|nr:50S ribosomal protein L7ae [Oscillospiraceae bacterium]
MADKVLSMIGMARRAGEAQTGAFLTERSIREGTCELIILATDTAQNNAKKFINASEYYDIPLIKYSTKAELSHALGKENVVVVGISDKNFAKGIMGKYNEWCTLQEQMEKMKK